jgi:hypothetical protein
VEDGDGKLRSRAALVEQKRMLVLERRALREDFWRLNVQCQETRDEKGYDMVGDEEILNVCMPVLQGLEKEWGTVFISAYQLWALLNEKDIAFCEKMQEAYGSEVGEGAGRHVTPVLRISHALTRSDKVERCYADGRACKFSIGDKDVVPSSVYDVFRLREERGRRQEG